jgi:carbon-monoxide dehydrogenase large subunit
VEQVAARNVGARVHRVEDPRILTGKGRYVDDVVLPGMLHAAFLRSYVPHGRLLSVDVEEARQLPGVVAVYTGADMERFTNPEVAGTVTMMNLVPGLHSPGYHPLATDKVRHVGDPIALVVAESRYIAEDALELIVEDIEPLDAVVTYHDALDPSKPALYDEVGHNVNLKIPVPIGGDVEGAFERADRIVRATIEVHRHQPVPMECRALIADWDPEAEHLTVHASTQSPHQLRLVIPPLVDLPMEKIRVLAADVGGGFGLKNGIYREDIAVIAAARDLGRPVKWIEDRIEHLTVGGQAREEMADVEAAVTSDGVILGARLGVKVNIGAYLGDPFPLSSMAFAIPGFFQGPMRLEALEADSTVVFTNKATYVAYRGPWATGDFLRERTLDVVADELGIDRVEIRRRNYVVRDEPPLAMLDGKPFLGITARECLDQAAEVIGWDDFRRRQEEARAEGRHIGIGVASYIEGAPGPKAPNDAGAGIMADETTYLSLGDDGKVVVITRQQPHGQGHQTTLTQVAADELGVRMEDVEIRFGDTDITPVALIGTGGSRAATMANGSVLHGSRDLKAKILDVAAELMEASAADLVIEDSVVSVRGTPTASISLAELARVVAEEPGKVSEGTDTDLSVTNTFDGGQSGWSGGTHACIVEVDVETGLVEIERYVVVEDCGLAVNPAIVDGQIRGGVAQGIGAVLLEHAAYGEDGQYLAASFMDYLMPTSTVIPPIEIHHIDPVLTDPDVNFRGVGEGGMIVSPAAVVSAVEDALSAFGVKVREQHLPPCRIVELVEGAAR